MSRAGQSRQARPEEAQEPSWGAAKAALPRGGHFGHAGKEKGSIFDALEDLDYQACLDKCVAISKA